MMARPDRLFRLLQAMRVLPAPITAARLAAETEVSLRSLYRDIDSLRAAGARIEGERGYGYRLIEDYALPPQTFDRDEIEALALGLAEVKRMGDPDIVRQACWREEALAIRYTDKAGAVSERTILPLAIVYTEGALTVLAWCCLREAFRMFRSDGIGELRLVGTSFRPRRVVLLRDYLAALRARDERELESGTQVD